MRDEERVLRERGHWLVGGGRAQDEREKSPVGVWMEPAFVVVRVRRRVGQTGGQRVGLEFGEIGRDGDGEVQHEAVDVGGRGLAAGDVGQGRHLEGDGAIANRDVIVHGYDVSFVEKGKAACGKSLER